VETSRGLAAFLRARRELLKPADVGLPGSERRRVEGLRREEVAMLAGISTEYYLRLEQGRDHSLPTRFLTVWHAPCNSTKTPPPTCAS
jgi:transcriptional regulator with XRE-family HTH domain